MHHLVLQIWQSCYALLQETYMKGIVSRLSLIDFIKFYQILDGKLDVSREITFMDPNERKT